ncbi:MAG TPA: Na+:solute symporter [Sedimentisphaerales bacterium]|nr:Na+:solute symporter [Sedimentisphaerales bacterium]
MRLEAVDWISVIAFFVISLVIGVVVAKRAGKSSSDFFLSGRSMPWWLLGVSMVATTFSTDTPNLVTDIVRQNGVSGNWVWWAFLLTGMLTVFVYAKLWRRSGVMTDIEFYELRYSGKTAAFLRGFRALYLGVFFNIVVMASVTLAAIKIGNIMLDLKPWQTVSIAAIITVSYSMLGGLEGVLITDFFQFGVAMFGAVAAAFIAVDHPSINGLSALICHPNVVNKLNFFPDFSNKDVLMAVFIIPLAVQWWSVWYPGSEPGGGGYMVQRMLAAKDEKNALGATLFFNVAHYALRPWPWIIVALCSLIVFPDLESLKTAFPNMNPNLIKHDMAYPAMLTFLPHGLLGLVVASLIAAYMSTIATQLN